MADGNLQFVAARKTQQDRLTNRRSGVLPERRNTDQPDLEINADMRSASRGDGGADELRRLFAGISDTATGALKQHGADKDKANGAKGQTDSLLGQEDVVLSAKSSAYHRAYTAGRGELDVLSRIEGMTTEVEELLNDPENQADPEDVDDLIHARLQEFLQPDGKDRDFGSPEARDVVYGHLRKWQADVRNKAVEKIKTQVATESLNTAGEVVRQRLRLGAPVTLKDFTALVIDTVDIGAQQETFLNAAIGVMEEYKLKDPAKALSISRMIRGEAAQAAGADPYYAAAEASILAGDEPAAPGAAPVAKPVTTAATRPRLKMTRDDVITHTLIDLEGGDAVVNYSQADGGVTKYGIAAKFNPGVDVANLTQAQAADITRKRYWFAGLDAADPATAAVAFDAGFIGGTKTGKRILAAAGGDPEKAVALYRAHLNNIADTVPGKAKYKQGWNNRVDRLARKLGLGGGATVDGDIGTILNIPVVDGNVPRPPSASDMAGAVPLDGSVPAIAGRGFTLSQAQRNKLDEYHTGLVKEIDAEGERVRKERHQQSASALLGRFIGIGGAKPTVSDIQGMVMRDEIDAETGYQTVNRMESDAREIRGEARAVRSEEAAQRTEVREQQKLRMDRRVNGFLGPVFSGAMPISEAAHALLKRSNAITDRDERTEFVQAVTNELGNIKSLRTEGAPYQSYMRNLDGLASELKRSIDPHATSKVRARIEADIDDRIAHAKVEGGRRGQDQGHDLDKAWTGVEKALVDNFMSRGMNTKTPRF